MDTKFLEATDGLAWGRFLIGRYTIAELRERTQCPGCESERRPLVAMRSWSPDKEIWFHDLVTGEAARFDTTLRKPWDLHKAFGQHRIWTCPLYVPALVWVMTFIDNQPDTWWDTLPRDIEFTDSDLTTYRRVGTPGRSDDEADLAS